MHKPLLHGLARCARHGSYLDEHLSAVGPVRAHRVYVCLYSDEPCVVVLAGELEANVRGRLLARLARMYELAQSGPGREYAARRWSVLDFERRRRLLNVMVRHVIVRHAPGAPLDECVEVVWHR